MSQKNETVAKKNTTKIAEPLSNAVIEERVRAYMFNRFMKPKSAPLPSDEKKVAVEAPRQFSIKSLSSAIV